MTFAEAQYAFIDPDRVIAEDLSHSNEEKRYYCFGKVDDDILTVRFTYRGGIIRIIGAGYWRRGKRIYERENQIHR
ncbi:MAG: BrnT family toxin [Gammaproteobacteria bacterium]|nr:BrnT family toxin [Gammaproteobacteria bacterium]